MRGLAVAACVLALAGAFAPAVRPAQAKEVQEYTVGPWTGFSYTSDDTGQFTDCTAWAFNRDNVQVGISVKKDWTLQFWLNSKNWNLPSNQSYPVSYWIDRNAVYSGKAVVSAAKFVYIDVDRAADVFEELKQGSRLTFRTKDIDYDFDLSGSRAALGRLVDCVDRYAKASTSNPFGEGGGSASNSSSFDGSSNQQDQSQQGSAQDGSGGEQTNGGQQGSSSNGQTNLLTSLTQTPDQVKAFLVEVTGAKPSMLSIESKTDKGGGAYYAFSTPLGSGQFWQEKPDGNAMKDFAESYLDGYKKQCSGALERSGTDQTDGPGGSTASATAYCPSSSFQDNGPEVVTYAVLQHDNVVSIYLSYVGGNAAKNKTDALGKLIGRGLRQAAQPQP